MRLCFNKLDQMKGTTLKNHFGVILKTLFQKVPTHIFDRVLQYISVVRLGQVSTISINLKVNIPTADNIKKTKGA